jgi:hypothetical protein
VNLISPAWRRKKWQQAFPHEGVAYDRLTLRQHLWAAILRPKQYARWCHRRFRLATVQPDDTFLDFAMDVYYEVRSVRREYVEVEPFSGQVMDMLRKGQLGLDDPRLVRVTERVPRPLPKHWWPT